MVLITLFTDASYCVDSGLSAYAVWAKTEGRTLRHVAMFKRPMQNIDMAEACAMINGVVVALQTIQPTPNSKILAQTDSLNAIDLLTTREQPYGGLADIMKTKLIAQQIRIEYRHVKAHKGTATPRNAVNTWCDRACRRLLRETRSQLPDNVLPVNFRRG